jgi:two-component system response regulator YesN
MEETHMEAYKAIVVDDEVWSGVSLQNAIDWQRHGFEKPRVFTSPAKALAHLDSQEVDVAFVDIRMPELDGLELVERAVAGGTGTLFVIVSGHSDFEFARRALRTGVYDYLLKPVSPKAGEAFAGKLRDALEKRKKDENALLYCRLAEGDQDAAARVLGKMPGSGRFWVLGVRDERGALPPAGPEGYRAFFRLDVGRGRTLFFARRSAETAEPAPLPAGVYLSASQEGTRAGQVPTLINQAEIALANGMFTGRNFSAYRPPGGPEIKKACEAIRAAVTKGDTGLLGKSVDALRADFEQNRLTIEDAVDLHNLFFTLPGKVAVAGGERVYGAYMLMEYYATAGQLLEVIGEAVVHAADLPAGRGQSVEEQLTRLLAYVDAHYTEDLSLKRLSDEYYISFTYCSELFKKRTNMSYTQYMTRLRMGRAAALLDEGAQSVQEIAENVGYHNYHYFLRCFKNYYGVTPSEYHTLIERNGEAGDGA